MAKKIVKRTELQGISVHDAVQEYLATTHVKQLSKKTQRGYRQDLNIFASWCASHALEKKQGSWYAPELDERHLPITLDLITDQCIYCFLEYLRTHHVSSKHGVAQVSTYTLAGYSTVIKTFLNWCLLHPEYKHVVHVETIRAIEKPKVIEVTIRPFTAEQVGALFDACVKEESEHLQVRDRAMIAVLLDTGLRANELVTLTIGNISLDARDAYVRVLGKGDKWGEIGLGERSQQYVRKYLRMFREPTIEHEVKHQQKNLSPRQLTQIVREMMKHAPMFVNRYGEQLTPDGLNQMVVRLGRWAHIEGVRCSPHTFRHTFAVMFWRRTHDIRTLSKLLRHSSIAVTENYLKSIQQAEARIGAPSMLDEL